MEKFLADHDLHAHTQLSACCHDSEMTARRLLEHAEKNGYRTQCVTNHLWDADVLGASEWYKPQDIAHNTELLPLPKSDKVRFLFGCETEFLGGDRLGLRPDHFDCFAFVIIPPNHFHMGGFVRPLDVNTPGKIAALMIARLNEIARLPLPFHKIGIAHLTTSLINRGGSKYDVIESINQDQFFEAMRAFAKNGAGIELNGACFKEGWLEHKEIELRLYKIAKEAGCKFYLGTDAHSVDKLDRVPLVLPAVIDGLGLTRGDQYIVP